MTEQPKTPLSPWAATFRVILDPVATFEALKDRMPVLPVYLVQMVAGLAVTLVTIPRILPNLATQFEKQNLPPQTGQIVKISAIGGGVFSALAVPWIAGLVVALIALFLDQFHANRVRYGAYLGMVGYARIPLTISSLVQGLLIMILPSTAKLGAMNLSLAVLVPQGTNPYIRALLGTLNPFDLWYFALLAIGFATLHGEKPSKGASLAVVLYVLGALMALVGVPLARLTGVPM